MAHVARRVGARERDSPDGRRPGTSTHTIAVNTHTDRERSQDGALGTARGARRGESAVFLASAHRGARSNPTNTEAKDRGHTCHYLTGRGGSSSAGGGSCGKDGQLFSRFSRLMDMPIQNTHGKAERRSEREWHLLLEEASADRRRVPAGSPEAPV